MNATTAAHRLTTAAERIDRAQRLTAAALKDVEADVAATYRAGRTLTDSRQAGLVMVRDAARTAQKIAEQVDIEANPGVVAPLVALADQADAALEAARVGARPFGVKSAAL